TDAEDPREPVGDEADLRVDLAPFGFDRPGVRAESPRADGSQRRGLDAVQLAKAAEDQAEPGAPLPPRSLGCLRIRAGRVVVLRPAVVEADLPDTLPGEPERPAPVAVEPHPERHDAEQHEEGGEDLRRDEHPEPLAVPAQTNEVTDHARPLRRAST